jgi:hypothetical protein
MKRVITFGFLPALNLDYDLIGRKSTATCHKVRQLTASFSIGREK